jgi:hypothetical protein
MSDQPSRVGVRTLVAVDEPERDERAEDERLSGRREDVCALQGRPRAGSSRRSA